MKNPLQVLSAEDSEEDALLLLREVREAADRKAGREAEAAMRSSENKYRHLFEALSDAAFVIEVESGRIIDTNAQAETLLGRTREKILGSNQTSLFPPQCAPAGIEVLRATAGTEQTGGCEMEVIRSDGKTVPVHASVSQLELYPARLAAGRLRPEPDGRAIAPVVAGSRTRSAFNHHHQP